MNLPIALTLTRLIFSPLALPFLLVYLLPLHLWLINSILAFLFILLSLTDFFDGYLARKYNQETALGALLDPIADKCLFYATLVALVAADKIFFYWAIILIGREFFVMGLRLVALENNIDIPVSWVAKVKTALQMICLTFIIINPYQALGLRDAFSWNGLELGLILATIMFSLFTAYQYYQLFISKYSLRSQVTPDWDNEIID